MHSCVRPNTHVVLRLPSQLLKIVEIIPNTNITLGKYGTFSSNQILGRPYYLTYELVEKEDGQTHPGLRVVPASELHAEVLGNDHAITGEIGDEGADAERGAGFDIVGENGEIIMRNNRMTIDDPSRQTLSMDEIEALKKAGIGSGKEIIAKIMASHMGIEEKTTFSLAKYTLRKSRKYLKRFTVLPLDISNLTDYVTEKEPYKIMEVREEMLGLICSWANVHHYARNRVLAATGEESQVGGGRWLVVDDTGGLVTAALAEKMGILYPAEGIEVSEDDSDKKGVVTLPPETGPTKRASMPPFDGAEDVAMVDADEATRDSAADHTSDPTYSTNNPETFTSRPKQPRVHVPQMSAKTNTLTILHPNNQPNVSHLKYFGFDAGNPSPFHPLYKHLKSISWLQLLDPTADPSFIEPEVITDDVLAGMKSSKRGTYYKKRRRWERVKSVVDETRSGGFDGLVVASCMDVKGIIKEAVPLVKGGGRVAVYSPNVEPLVELCDYYSKERRSAYIAREFGKQQNSKADDSEDGLNGLENGDAEDEDFPVNPMLLLAPSLQTARAKHWQVLPQRTHPFMTSKGGAEGYLFTATRVIPIEGKVEARGHGRGKKRKTGPDTKAQV